MASQAASPNVASKCGVTCPHCVREPGAWLDVASKRARTWRQNVASLAHVASGSQVAWQAWRQNVASLAHVTSGSQVASQDVASKCGVTCLGGVREPGGVAGRGVKMCSCQSERGVKMWRHLPTWRQGATWRRRTLASKRGCRRHRSTWRHRTWRQNVASRSQASRHVSSKCVFSRRAICAPPQATTLSIYTYVYAFVRVHVCMYACTHVWMYAHTCLSMCPSLSLPMYIFIYIQKVYRMVCQGYFRISRVAKPVFRGGSCASARASCCAGYALPMCL